MFNTFEKMCSQFDMSGSILEVGSGPSEETLLNMKCVIDAKYKIGVNLISFDHYKDFKVIECNANDMHIFRDSSFDVVLCNAVLEHDRFFWKSLSEIRRVLRRGGMFFLGVPGLVGSIDDCKQATKEQRIKFNKIKKFFESTVTYKVHNAPKDYYRFTVQAYKEVLMEGFTNICCEVVFVPPRLIGHGVRL